VHHGKQVNFSPVFTADNTGHSKFLQCHTEQFSSLDVRDYIIIIIIIIIKQLVMQQMSVKNKLTNRSCGLATAFSDEKRCVFKLRHKRQDMRHDRSSVI